MFSWSHGAQHPELPSAPEPQLGWRLWRLRGGWLDSWGVRHRWRPGENHAMCLGERHCVTSPGEGCNCGFWALFSPLRCLRYARDNRKERSAVLGLVRGWGVVAIHGEEGFRAQYATVLCLFSDWVWDVPQLPHPALSFLGPWWRTLQRLRISADAPVVPTDTRDRDLGQVASNYGVPVLSLDAALESGLLSEFGATAGMRDEVQGWSRQTAATKSHSRGRGGPV